MYGTGIEQLCTSPGDSGGPGNSFHVFASSSSTGKRSSSTVRTDGKELRTDVDRTLIVDSFAIRQFSCPPTLSLPSVCLPTRPLFAMCNRFFAGLPALSTVLLAHQMFGGQPSTHLSSAYCNPSRHRRTSSASRFETPFLFDS